MIRFSNYPARDLGNALSKEWLETNGIGGFASSTIVGLNTRRYHGLLTAATRPPVGRVVLLSKLEETLLTRDRQPELCCNEYRDVIHPKGYLYLEEFRLDPFPHFVYRVDDIVIEKQVFAAHGENTVVIQYQASAPCVLELRPLIAFRDYHSLTHRNDALNRKVQVDTELVSIKPYPDLPDLHFAHNAKTVEPAGDWYFSFRYRVEQERGLDHEEDLFQPFLLRFDLRPEKTASVVVSTRRCAVSEADLLREREIERRSKIRRSGAIQSEFVETLSAAADQFIVQRGDLQTVIAGYHWFSDWGRDTMIALPGLTCTTGRFETAKNILLAFVRAADHGMLPNRWPDAGEMPEYNTADATLWLFEAVGAYVQHTNDYQAIETELFESLSGIIDWQVRGTRYGIRVQENGLLACGEPGSNLTWMDARVDGVPVTPRMGMPVEIQALWYNALRTMEHLSTKLGKAADAERFDTMAARAQSAFEPLFWNPETNCLYDVINEGDGDGAIRPNQLFAVSLTYPLLRGERALLVVDRVERDLLTPYGLRSLAPDHPRYIGRCEGNPQLRDAAYHQGTVWSWLLGPFVTAYLRAHDHTAAALGRVSTWLEPTQKHLSEAGLGQISEIFDGDPPHRPRGCIAQAWSVGETVRILSDLQLSSKNC